MSVTATVRTGTTKVNSPSKPPIGKKAPTKVPSAKVTKVNPPSKPPVGKKPVKKVAAKVAAKKTAGKQGKVPAVGFGKQRVNANKKMLLLAKAKQEMRKRGGSGKA